MDQHPTRRRLALRIASLVAVAGVCATLPIAASRSSGAVPEEVGANRSVVPFPLPDGSCDSSAVYWSGESRSLYVITWGSGSCPTLAVAAVATGADEVTIEFAETWRDREVCSADLSATVSRVSVPYGVDDGEPLTVRFGEWGKVIVEPRLAPGKPGPLACLGGLNPPLDEIEDGEFELSPLPHQDR